jgi:uncharacterized protein YyaL (SSP411 family)
VLQRAISNEELSQLFDTTPAHAQEWLDSIHKKLLTAREQRIRPGTDDKVLVSWNALALTAFASAARYLDRDDYLEVARRNADFLLTELMLDGRLQRSWRRGHARHNAYLEDYAALILALLDLYQSDPDPYWFRSATQLSDEMVRHYRDPAGGFYDTRDDQEELLLRPKELQDNATPSGSSLAAMALLQLSTYTANGEWRDMAEAMLGSIQEIAARYPTSFANWLSAIHYAIGPVREVAILGDPNDEQTQSLSEILWTNYLPDTVVAQSVFPPPPNAPPLVLDRPLLEGRPTAYVCENFVCLQPVNDPQELKEQLNA